MYKRQRCSSIAREGWEGGWVDPRIFLVQQTDVQSSASALLCASGPEGLLSSFDGFLVYIGTV